MKYTIVWHNQNGNWGVVQRTWDDPVKAVRWALKDARKMGWARVEVAEGGSHGVHCFRSTSGDPFAWYSVIPLKATGKPVLEMFS